LRAAVVKDGLYAVAPFVLLPIVLYVVAWTGWFVSDGKHAYDHDRYVHPGQSWWAHDRAVFGGWLRYQWEIYDFHRHLSAAHPYLSRPWGWLLLARPVSYFYAAPQGACGAGNTCAQEVLAIGTPAIWWVAIPALVVTAWRMIGRLDWRAAAILVTFAAGYLPWFWADAQHRTMFLFYLLPDVPFMVLALTLGIGLALGSARVSALRRTLGTVGAGAYLLAVLANFAYFMPVLSGGVLTYDQWRHRIWLDSCNTAPHRNQHHENAPCWI
jgi:dolichyl-phosphate-mannose--protein O-mannosyl transferase